MVTSCCVCGVEKGSLQDLNLSFHRFPKNEGLKLKWWETIGKEASRNAHICSKHFKTEDYENCEDLSLTGKILKPSAVPSVHIKLSKQHIKLKPIENSLSDIKNILTVENDERKIKNTLKLSTKQRYQNGILGVVRREDFINENAWLRFQKHINMIKRQYKLLSGKNRKLHYEINIFKELLKKQLSRDVLER